MESESSQKPVNARQIYGLPTTIAMIVGIVVGSGIFFKADNILIATGGSVSLGIMLLTLGAAAVIFGSLTIAEFAVRSDNSGGFVDYFDTFVGQRFGAGFGVFQTLVYYPAIQVVVGWASIIFLSLLLNIELTLEQQVIGAGVLTLVLTALNYLSRKLAGNFQNLATVVKLIPLFVFAAFGIFYTGAQPQVPAGVEVIPAHSVGFGWLASLAPIAFSYDGWPIATTIAPEVRNAKKTMSRALVAGPIIVLIVYLLYFTGITRIAGPEYIMSMGDASVQAAATMIFGSAGAKLIMVFVVIAMVGVCNGVLLGGIRMPQALAERNILFPQSVARLDERYQLSPRSVGIYLLAVLIWMIAHYITQKTNVLNGRDVSEIAIVFSYAIYVVLYSRVFKMYQAGEIKSSFKGVICPLLASLGSAVILIGGLISSPVYIGIEIIICAIFFLLGMKALRQKGQKA